MKCLILQICLAMAFTFNVSAQGARRPVPTVLKELVSNFEKLGKQIDDKSKNAESAELVQTMVYQSKDVAKQIPPAVAGTKKAKEKESAMENYIHDMDEKRQRLLEIKDLLTANKNAEARKKYDALKPKTNAAHFKKYE